MYLYTNSQLIESPSGLIPNPSTVIAAPLQQWRKLLHKPHTCPSSTGGSHWDLLDQFLLGMLVPREQGWLIWSISWIIQESRTILEDQEYQIKNSSWFNKEQFFLITTYPNQEPISWFLKSRTLLDSFFLFLEFSWCNLIEHQEQTRTKTRFKNQEPFLDFLNHNLSRNCFLDFLNQEPIKKPFSWFLESRTQPRNP